MLKDNKNANKPILITGASQGIGKACAIKFLKEGYKVAVLARNKNKLESTFNIFESALILSCDVSNYDQVNQSFEVIKKKWGRLDVLFNNAGIGVKANTPENISFEDWKRIDDEETKRGQEKNKPREKFTSTKSILNFLDK